MINESEGNINLFRVASLIGVGEKEIIKNVVLESLLLLRFLGEQKLKDRASAENRKYSVCINMVSREIDVVQTSISPIKSSCQASFKKRTM